MFYLIFSVWKEDRRIKGSDWNKTVCFLSLFYSQFYYLSDFVILSIGLGNLDLNLRNEEIFAAAKSGLDVIKHIVSRITGLSFTLIDY
jgi:hypothetical protein